LELPSMQDIEAAQAASNSEFHESTISSLVSCVEWLDRLSQLLDEKTSPESAPSFSDLKHALAEIRRTVESSPGYLGETSESEGQGVAQGAAANAPQGNPNQIAIVDRNSAFRAIESAAQFLERTEPHSPLAYSLRRILLWGKLTLPQLYKELGIHADVFHLSGVPDPDKEGNQ